MRKKILIFNGPPLCGKDTAVTAILATNLQDVAHLKFSQPLKDLVNGMGISPTNPDYRSYQISAFQMLSKVFGVNWLGRYMVNQLHGMEEEFILCSDGSLPEEIEPLFLDNHKVMIVQILRDGCHFGYDIRQYISHPRALSKTILNDDLASFKQKVIDIAYQFFAE